MGEERGDGEIVDGDSLSLDGDAETLSLVEHSLGEGAAEFGPGEVVWP